MRRLWIAFACAWCVYLPGRVVAQGGLPAQQGTVVTKLLAGGGLDPGEGVFGWQASFLSPNGVAVDAAGNVYISERNRVRKVGIDGIVTTVAGVGEDGDTGDSGPATKAKLYIPVGMVFGADGSLYLCDSNNNRVRKVDPNGVISTVAGTGQRGLAGDNGQATRAALSVPRDIALDSAGNLYIADVNNNRVRKVAKDGVITTFAGGGSTAFTDGMPATQASLNGPNAVAVDGNGNVYVSAGNRVYKIDTGGAIKLIAGGGSRAASAGAQATAAQLVVTDLAVDGEGAVYTGGVGAGVVKVGTDGLIAILPATGINSYSGIAVDGEGAVYVVEQFGKVYRIASTTRKRPEGSHLRVAARSLPFDVTALNNTVQKRFLLLSAGGAALSVSGITVTGENASEFSATPTQASVGSGDTVAVTVSFKPASAGAKRATLSIAHNGQGSPFNLPLTGVGLQPPGGAVTISTLAGTGTAGFGGDGGQAAFSVVNGPQGMAVGPDGSVYFADTQNHRIRKIGKDGIITTVAGTGTAGFSGDGGPAASAQVNAPTDVAVGSDGAVYIADNRNNRIRKVGTDGVITTIAGRSASFSGDGGPAAQANLRPSGIDVDSKGNIYVAGDARIRRIGTDGIIWTIAGSGSTTIGPEADGKLAIESAIAASDVTVDGAGNYYIAHGNYVRKVDGAGIITTVAGAVGVVNDGDGGPATQAPLSSVGGIAVDAYGALYIAADDRVRRVGLDGVITSAAGGGSALGDGGGPTKGQVRAASIAMDANGTFYITERFSHRVRRVGAPVAAVTGPGVRLSGETLAFDVVDAGKTLQKTVTITNTGNAALTITGITLDGADAALFTVTPTSGTVAAGQSLEVTITFAPASGGEKKVTLVIAHNATGSPSRVALSGIGKAASTTQVTYTISTLAGTGTTGFSGDGGPATSAQFSSLTDVAVDAKGNLYVADFTNNRVRRIAPDGTISTFAGGATGVPGTGNGLPATQAVLIGPSRVTVDRDGNVYISDSGSQRVARVGTDGVFRTIAGETSILGGFAGDGGAATQARLNTPQGLVVDRSGNVYLIDQLNNRIRKVSPEGTITTVAGGGTNTGENVPATQAQIRLASGVAVGSDGSLFITDLASIRRIGPDGFISTIAGTGRAGFSGDGGPALQAQVSRPGAVVVDGSGNLYIADSANNRVRKLTPSGGTGGQQAPSISLSASSLAFGSANVGATSPKTLTISNGGNASLSVTGITVTGTNAAEFRVSPTSGTVEAGKSLAVTVTFAPASAGEKSATLAIAHNAGESPSSVRLSGTGVAATSPSSLTPKAGDGTGTLDLDVAAGDQNVRTLGGVKAGQKVDVQVLLNREFASATAFQVVLKYDTTKVSVVGSKKDGTAFASAIDLAAQTKGDSVTYGASFLGSTTTARKEAVAVLTFQTASGYSGDTEIKLQSLAIRVAGAFNTLTPGASVVLSSSAAASSAPTPDFDGDGEVGFADFFAFASVFGQKVTSENKKFDLDGDGDIGFGDFFAFAGEFGKKR